MSKNMKYGFENIQEIIKHGSESMQHCYKLWNTSVMTEHLAEQALLLWI